MQDKNQSRLRRARQTRLKIREIGAVRLSPPARLRRVTGPASFMRGSAR